MPSRSPSRLRLAVLVSGTGTNLQALLNRIAEDPSFGGEVVVVGSDQHSAAGLERAREAGVPTVVRALEDASDRGAWEAGLRTELEAYAPDLVVLAGFMRILSGAFLEGWPHRVVNAHPSLLPAFRGAHAVRDALAHGVKLTGSTVHLVDELVDHGPIVAQEAVAVHDDDTQTSLHERIKDVEHRLLPAVVKLMCHGRVQLDGRRVRISEEPVDPQEPS